MMVLGSHFTMMFERAMQQNIRAPHITFGSSNIFQHRVVTVNIGQFAVFDDPTFDA